VIRAIRGAPTLDEYATAREDLMAFPARIDRNTNHDLAVIAGR
jgi:hypothetical protein